MLFTKNPVLKFLFIFASVVACLPITNLLAQEEPSWDEFQKNFKKDYFSVGGLLQVVGDGQLERSFPGNTGFNISNMRLLLYGEFDKGFGYFFQTNFIGTTSILDAKMYYRISPSLIIDVGQFKSPFGAEFLIYAGSIDFVNRSQAVSLLVPGRQIGVQLRGWLTPDVLHYSAGLFNGNSFSNNSNDNNDFLYAARLALYPQKSNSSNSTNHLEFGFNLAYSNDERATLLGGIVPNFNGSRTLVGGDFRWTNSSLLLSSEIIYSSLDFPNGSENNPWGLHLTGGYMLNEKSQLLLRWESMTFDVNTLETDFLIFGYNLWPTQATEIQINYIIDTDNSAIKHHQLLVNAQVGF